MAFGGEIYLKRRKKRKGKQKKRKSEGKKEWWGDSGLWR